MENEIEDISLDGTSLERWTSMSLYLLFDNDLAVPGISFDARLLAVASTENWDRAVAYTLLCRDRFGSYILLAFKFPNAPYEQSPPSGDLDLTFESLPFRFALELTDPFLILIRL